MQPTLVPLVDATISVSSSSSSPFMFDDPTDSSMRLEAYLMMGIGFIVLCVFAFLVCRSTRRKPEINDSIIIIDGESVAHWDKKTGIENHAIQTMRAIEIEHVDTPI
jgi:hypothetical protein